MKTLVVFLLASALTILPAMMYAATSSFPEKRAATGNATFIFDPRKLKWAAYDRNGNLIRTGKASGGKGYCRDVGRACRTPRGIYTVYHKGSSGCKSSKYPIGRGGAPMPYCMFFHRGYAIHGSPDVPNYNASHGCIRVLPSAAKWLSRNILHHGATVIVKPY
jgi:lipoprotein-anchoring transpeptidase ErfK/SrfK